MSGDELERLRREIENVSCSDTAFIVLSSQKEDQSELGNSKPVFCAGADLKEFRAAETQADFERIFLGFARLIDTLRTSPQIVIARVHGAAVGGGVGVIAASDFAIAGPGAKVRLSELTFGIGPYVIGPAVERKIGAGHFSALSLDTEPRSAEWASSVGLYQQLVASPSDLDREIGAFIARFEKASLESLFAWKRTLWAGTDNWPELLQSRAHQVSTLARAARK